MASSRMQCDAEQFVAAGLDKKAWAREVTATASQAVKSGKLSHAVCAYAGPAELTQVELLGP